MIVHQIVEDCTILPFSHSSGCNRPPDQKRLRELPYYLKNWDHSIAKSIDLCGFPLYTTQDWVGCISGYDPLEDTALCYTKNNRSSQQWSSPCQILTHTGKIATMLITP